MLGTLLFINHGAGAGSADRAGGRASGAVGEAGAGAGRDDEEATGGAGVFDLGGYESEPTDTVQVLDQIPVSSYLFPIS